MMKKDLLLVVHRIPYPPDKGDKIRTYNFMRYLSSRYRVTLVCMIDDPDDIKYISELEKIVDSVQWQYRSRTQMKLQVGKALICGDPFSLHCFYSSKLQDAVDRYLDTTKPVAILSFCSSMAEYLFRSRHRLSELAKNTLILNDLIDVDSAKWNQYAEKHKNIIGWLYRREGRLLLKQEAKIADQFHRTYLVSPEEVSVLAEFGDVSKVFPLANGVDLEYFNPSLVDLHLYPAASCKLVFSGAMDYWPNIEAAQWFCDNILPLVRDVFPHVEFCIAGRNPTPEIRALEKIDGVVVTGTVPDMRNHLATATVCVVPLLIARGIQNKVLEAMAMAKPVVATRGAATGTTARNRDEIIITDNSEDMAREIINLLEDKKKAERIGVLARKYVENHHSWSFHLQQMVDYIEDEKSLLGDCRG